MSFSNYQFMRKQDYELHAKTFTATGTVRTGTATYNGLFDNPVIVSDPAADVTLTIPDGEYVGQELVIVFESNDNSKTLTVTATTGTDYSSTTAGQWTKICWTGATSGWLKIAGTFT